MASALPRSLPAFSPAAREHTRCRARQRVELSIARRRSRGHSSHTCRRFLRPAGRLPPRFPPGARQSCCAIPGGGTNPRRGWNPPGRARHPLIRPLELRAPLRAQLGCHGCSVQGRLSRHGEAFRPEFDRGVTCLHSSIDPLAQRPPTPVPGPPSAWFALYRFAFKKTSKSIVESSLLSRAERIWLVRMHRTTNILLVAD